MSRIGKQPITLSAGVTATLEKDLIQIKGPKGELNYQVHPDITVAITDNVIQCSIKRPSQHASALWGTTRARLASMVNGVTTGFTKQLELQGVGYRAALKGKDIELAIGFSHPVKIEAPDGIAFTVEKEIITVAGIDAYLVGQIASDIRLVRPPEPYKGKGIRYVGEKVRRKVGKAVGTTT